jgi:hypothetical protein
MGNRRFPNQRPDPPPERPKPPPAPPPKRLGVLTIEHRPDPTRAEVEGQRNILYSALEQIEEMARIRGKVVRMPDGMTLDNFCRAALAKVKP